MALEYDQKEFLELLHPFKSDETMKARRNVSTISFLIISLWVLGISIKDVHVFGVTLKQSSEFGVLLIALGLLLYWLGMFLLAWFQDREIQKERSHLLDEQISNIVNRFKEMDKDKKEKEESGQNYFGGGSYGKFKASYEIIEAQTRRTEKAGKLVDWVKRLELLVPVGLSFLALLVLISGLVCVEFSN